MRDVLPLANALERCFYFIVQSCRRGVWPAPCVGKDKIGGAGCLVEQRLEIAVQRHPNFSAGLFLNYAYFPPTVTVAYVVPFHTDNVTLALAGVEQQRDREPQNRII